MTVEDFILELLDLKLANFKIKDICKRLLKIDMEVVKAVSVVISFVMATLKIPIGKPKRKRK